jgi:hypothetical protein
MSEVYHIDSDNTPVIPVQDSNGNAVDFSTATRFVAEHFGETNFTVDTAVDAGAITGGADGVSLNYSGLTQLNTIDITRDFGTFITVSQIDRSSPVTQYYDIAFNDDGTSMFTLEQPELITLWTLTSPWNIATATETATTFTVQSQGRSMAFKPDGLKMFGAKDAFNAARIQSYTLGTAWDITTAVYDGIGGDYTLPGTNQNSAEAKFKPDGTKMYVVQDFPYRLHQYTLGTAWDITTATADGVTVVLAGDVDNSTDYNIAFVDDGLSFFEVTDSAGQGVHLWQYTLSTAWDISTVTSETDLGSLTTNGVAPRYGLYIAPTPEPYFYVADNFGYIEQYNYDLVQTFTPIEEAEGTYLVRLTVYDAVTPNGRFLTHERCGPYLCLEVC